jgi:endoglucanase
MILHLSLLAVLIAASEAQYDYNKVISQSLLFYEAQRSGDLPNTNRVPWQGDSALGDQIPGGYYDGENQLANIKD